MISCTERDMDVLLMMVDTHTYPNKHSRTHTDMYPRTRKHRHIQTCRHTHARTHARIHTRTLVNLQPSTCDLHFTHRYGSCPGGVQVVQCTGDWGHTWPLVEAPGTPGYYPLAYAKLAVAFFESHPKAGSRSSEGRCALAVWLCMCIY